VRKLRVISPARFRESEILVHEQGLWAGGHLLQSQGDIGEAFGGVLRACDCESVQCMFQ